MEPTAALPRFVTLELEDGGPGVEQLEFENDGSGPLTIAALWWAAWQRCSGRAAPCSALVAIGTTSVEGLPARQALDLLRTKRTRPLNLIFMNTETASAEEQSRAMTAHELSAVAEEGDESNTDDELASEAVTCPQPTPAVTPDSCSSIVSHRDEDGEDYAEQLEDAESRAEVVAELLTEAKARVARACTSGVAVQSQVAEIEKQEQKLCAALLVSNAATLHRRIEAQLPKLQTRLQEKSQELGDLQRLAARGDEEVENLSKEHDKLMEYIAQLRVLLEAENIREAQQAALASKKLTRCSSSSTVEYTVHRHTSTAQDSV